MTTATERYLAALLAGDATGGDEESFDLDVTGSEATESVLTTLVENDERAPSIAELVSAGLAVRLNKCSTVEERTIEVQVSERHLDAVVQNERFALESRTATVEAALLRYLNTSSADSVPSTQ